MIPEYSRTCETPVEVNGSRAPNTQAAGVAPEEVASAARQNHVFRSQRPPGALGPRSGPGLSSPLVPCRLFILNHTQLCQTSLHKAEARPCRLAPAPNSSPTSRPAWLVWDVMLQRGSRILQRGALGESEDLVALMAGLAGKELMKIRPLQHLHDLLARKLKSQDNCVHCLGQRASRPAWGQLSTPPPPPCLSRDGPASWSIERD